MEVFQKEIAKNRLLEVGLKLHHLKKIQLILYYGSQVMKINQAGTHHGDLEDLAGIQNAQQCLKKHLDFLLTFMVVEEI